MRVPSGDRLGPRNRDSYGAGSTGTAGVVRRTRSMAVAVPSVLPGLGACQLSMFLLIQCSFYSKIEQILTACLKVILSSLSKILSKLTIVPEE